MKILIVIDKYGSAIDRLAQLIKKYATRHEVNIVALHPKRPDGYQLDEVVDGIKWCEVVDVHYWKSGEVIDKDPELKHLWQHKKKVLFHFNPYDLDQKNWRDLYDAVVVGNKIMAAKMPSAHLIEYGLDLDFWKFNDNWGDNPQPVKPIVQMTVGRIEKTKGVREVAQACAELGYQFWLVGRISKQGYFQEVVEKSGKDFKFFEDIKDDQLKGLYYLSTVHVCNSYDNFESGTLPILEAMACGLPVVTRNVGHVPDLFNGQNMVINDEKEWNVDYLKTLLKDVVESPERLRKIREAGWETIKSRDARRMVHKIVRLYNKVLRPQQELVSIIIPTKDNLECFGQALINAALQDYQHKEIVVVDSGYNKVDEIVKLVKEKTGVVIHHIKLPWSSEYNLAQARNMGVLEAEGSVICLCDDRIGMEYNAISEFMRYLGRGSWLWGVKDGTSKAFVENFSMVNRDDLIAHGMFNERIVYYGGMSEDIRNRFEKINGMNFELILSAKAKGIKRAAGKRNRREQIINAKWLIHQLYS